MLPRLSVICSICSSREYPLFKGTYVTGVSDTCATFVSELYSLGNCRIVDAGFVYSSKFLLSLTSSNSVRAGIPAQPGIIKAIATKALPRGNICYVRPYAVTEDRIVYGPLTSFISKGGKMPEVTKVSPAYALWTDTVTLTGRYFSDSNYETRVFLGTYECNVISSIDTCIKFILNPMVTSVINFIAVEVSGNRVQFTKDTLFLNLPVIDKITPDKGIWGDSITLTGKRLNYIEKYFYQGNITYLLGDKSCQNGVKKYADSIRVKVPDEVDKIKNSFKINIGTTTITSLSEFTLLPPSGFTVYPAEGTWGDVLTLRGSFHKTASRNSVQIGSYNALITSSSVNELKCIVPQGVSGVKNPVTYLVSPFTVISADSFRLKAPVITSVFPLSGRTNTQVIIKGKYFFPGNTTVKFENATASISDINDSSITTYVPLGAPAGNCRITVTVKLQTTEAGSLFSVVKPVITNISPLSGTFNEEITVTGNNFIPGDTYIYLGSKGISPVSVSTERVVFRIPTNTDSVPKEIKLRAGPDEVTYPDKFVLLPHQIHSVNPTEAVPGSEIEITGINFNPEYYLNTVYIDLFPAVVTSSSPNMIRATLPQGLPGGSLSVKVVTGSYTRYSPVGININSPFIRISAPKIKTKYPDNYNWYMANYGKVINSKGYVASAAENAVYEFNPANNSWTNLNINQPFKANPTMRMGEVVCRDTLYLISGHTGGSYMYAYNPASNEWRTFNLVSPAPVNVGGVAFVFNDVIFFGYDYTGYPNGFWSLEPSNGYKWTIIPELPFITNSYVSAYFQIGNRGYVVFSNNIVLQCEADNDTLKLNWVQKNNFPGTPRQMGVSFVLNGLAYFGAGFNSYNSLNDLWRYNPSDDTWTLIGYIPGKRHGAVAFSIYNKAYIGFGSESSYWNKDLFDFYEFDPDLLKK